MRTSVYNACMDYLLRNSIRPSKWAVKDDSLVWYDYTGVRHVVPLCALGVA